MGECRSCNLIFHYLVEIKIEVPENKTSYLCVNCYNEIFDTSKLFKK